MNDEIHKQKLAVRDRPWISEQQARAYASYCAAPAKPRLREYLWIVLCLVLGWLWLSQNEHIASLAVLEQEHRVLVEKCTELNATAAGHAEVIATLLDRGGQLQVHGKTVTVCYRKGRM